MGSGRSRIGKYADPSPPCEIDFSDPAADSAHALQDRDPREHRHVRRARERAVEVDLRAARGETVQQAGLLSPRFHLCAPAPLLSAHERLFTTLLIACYSIWTRAARRSCSLVLCRLAGPGPAALVLCAYRLRAPTLLPDALRCFRLPPHATSARPALPRCHAHMQRSLSRRMESFCRPSPPPIRSRAIYLGRSEASSAPRAFARRRALARSSSAMCLGF